MLDVDTCSIFNTLEDVQQIPCSPKMLGRQSLGTTNVVEVIGLSWFHSLSCPNPTWQLDNLEMVKHMKRPASSSAQKKIVKKPAQKQPSKGLAKKPSMRPVHKEEEKVDSPVHNVEEKVDSPAQDARGEGVGLFFFPGFLPEEPDDMYSPSDEAKDKAPCGWLRIWDFLTEEQKNLTNHPGASDGIF